MARPRLARRLSGGGIHERRRRQRREASHDRRPPARLDPGAAGGSDGRSPSGLAELEGRLAVLHTQFWGSTVPHFGFSIFPALRTPGRGRRTSPGFRLECFRGLLDRLFPDSRIARSPSSGRSGFPCSPVSLLPSFAIARFAPLRHSGFSGFVLSCFRDFRTRPEDRPRIPAGDLSRSSGFPGCPLSILPGAPAFPVPPVSLLPSFAIARFAPLRHSGFSGFGLSCFRDFRTRPEDGPPDSGWGPLAVFRIPGLPALHSSGRSGFPCSPVSLLPSFAIARFAPLRHSGFSGFGLSITPAFPLAVSPGFWFSAYPDFRKPGFRGCRNKRGVHGDHHLRSG